MACRYHPDSKTSGNCVDCGAEYCEECENPIVRHGILCLDCGAKFARKKIITSIAFAVLGFVIGLQNPNAARGTGSPAITNAFLGAYIFWATYFGYHYGGFWAKVGKMFGDSLARNVMFLALRLTVSIMLGAFGGGIVQFTNYWKTMKKKAQLQSV